MKKLLSFLTWGFLAIFVVSGLYLFEIWPFQPKDNLMPSADKENTTETSNPEELPENLQEDKVGRAKSYDEHMHRGELLENNQYNSLAIAEYEQAMKLQPENPSPYLQIGRIQLRMQEFAKAQENFAKAAQLNPQNLDIKIYLVRSLLAQRKISEAQKTLEGVDADSQNLKYYQGILAAFFGEHERAKQLLQKVEDLGTYPDISNKAANYLNAYAVFSSYQSGIPIHLKTLLARSYDQTGEYQMAIALLFDVIKEKKDYRDAWIILGHAYVNIGKYQDALESFLEAKKIDPDNAQIYFFLGLAHHGLNDFQNAAKSLEQAKKLGYQPVIQINQKLAEIYLEMKEYKKSAENYEQALKLNDDDVNFYIRPIWLYIEKTNEPQKALILAQTSLKNHANQAMSYNLAGWAYLANNNLPKAEESFKKALKLDPKLDAVYLNYGRLEQKRLNFDKALGYYQKAVNLGQNNSIAAAATELYNKLVAEIQNNDTMKADVLNP